MKLKQIFSKINRLAYFLSALAIGFVITYGISMISNKTNGPLITVFDQLTGFIYQIEHKVVLDRREDQRIDKLKWFAGYKNNKEKLINPDFILLGASDASRKNSYENIINLEDSLDTTFPLIHIYSAWGSRTENAFPESAVKAIYDLGSVPFITWEPWVSDFDEKKYKRPSLSINKDKSMLQIAHGIYDLYIKEWAVQTKKFGHPIYLRFGHEMNDPHRYPWGSNSNTPEEYIKAWQHVHDIFTYMGADNVIWVWSPHIAYSDFDVYYPGDKYVDAVSATVLNYGSAVSWSQWWSFEEIFGIHYPELAKFGKSIIISEFGSLSEGGDRISWFSDALHNLPQKYPAVSSIIFFHYSEDYTVTSRKVNWYIKNDASAVEAIKKEFESILKFKRKS